MTNLFTRWWESWRRRRAERAAVHAELEDDRGQAHLDRQRNGIRDVPYGGGGL
jgi:hypothetical protein